MFAWLWEPAKTPKQRLKECKSELRKNVRSLGREVGELQKMEAKLLHDIKPAAMQGKVPLVKIMCRNLVVVRRGIEKLYQSRGQIEAIQISLTVNHSTQVMAEAMRGATRAMMMASSHVNVQQLLGVMKQYEVNSDQMEFKQEMMNDSMDSIFATDGEAEESEMEIFNQIMDEVGINMEDLMQNAGSGVTKEGVAGGNVKVKNK